MKRMTYLSVVVYTRNEAPAVAALVARLTPFLREHFELHEIVLVDDSSTDGTAAVAREAVTSNESNAVVLELARRHGVENAMKAGLDRALGDWVVELESADLDFELDLLLEMYDRGSRGFDIVTASGDTGTVRSRLFYRVVNRYAELDAPLRTERVRLVSRRTLNAMLGMKEKVRYRKALYAVVGSRQDHLQYVPQPHLLPNAHRRLDRETSSLAFDILLSFSGFGLRTAHRLSFTFGAISVIAVFYALFIYLTRDNVVEGWTTVTVLTSGGFAGLFLVLGVLGEYLARILIEVRGRPLYAIRDSSTHVGEGWLPEAGAQSVPPLIALHLDAASPVQAQAVTDGADDDGLRLGRGA